MRGFLTFIQIVHGHAVVRCFRFILDPLCPPEFFGVHVGRHSDPKLSITFGNCWGKLRCFLLSFNTVLIFFQFWSKVLGLLKMVLRSFRLQNRGALMVLRSFRLQNLKILGATPISFPLAAFYCSMLEISWGEH